MNCKQLLTFRHAGILLGLMVAVALGLGMAAPANAANPKEAITASFEASTGVLKVSGDEQNNTIAIGRDAAGTILVNGGAVPITGGPSTVANTKLIEVFGLGKNDQLSLDEANGPLPSARMWGGARNDVIAGGDGDDVLIGGPGLDTLDGGPGDNVVIQGYYQYFLY